MMRGYFEEKLQINNKMWEKCHLEDGLPWKLKSDLQVCSFPVILDSHLLSSITQWHQLEAKHEKKNFLPLD